MMLTRTLTHRFLTTSITQTPAAVCTSLGSRLTYQLDWPVQAPKKNEVMIKVAGVGVNFAEILQTRGLYQEKKEPPFVPGNECSGEVCEVGPESNLKIGDKVICLARGNGYASHVVADTRACIKIPDYATNIDLEEAAGLLVNYGTAHLALTTHGNLKNNETVLVTAAAGGVGLATCELAKLLGAKNVIGCVGSQEKLDIAISKGATSGLIYTGLDSKQLKSSIKEAAPDGIDVVVDMVGSNVLEPCIRSLKWNGRGVIVGFAGGDIPKIPANILLVKNISIHGLFWGAHMLHDPKTILSSANKLVEYWLAGDIKPHVSKRVPLKDVNDAFKFIDDRKSTGKVILIP
jgi:NADPH:quinone reductase-like Zn-dependent oxidoreductase